MMTVALAFGLAMLVASVATPLVAQTARRWGWLDVPTEARKVHDAPTPRLGGIAVMAAVIMALAAVGLGSPSLQGAALAEGRLVVGFVAGTLAIWALGLTDDLYGLGARQKFAFELAVAFLMWLAGFRIESLAMGFGLELSLGALSAPLTMVWIVGVANAVNLIDGLDGLASGVSLIALSVLFAIALVEGNTLLATALAAFGGALVGFLFFNFHPARIFLGDSGSLTLGFVLSLSTVWTHAWGTGATSALWIPLLVLALPLLDTSLAIVRRLSRKTSPFAPDREHLHHRLMALGHSHRNTVLILYLLATTFALSAFNSLADSLWQASISAALALCTLALLVHRVGLLGAKRSRDLRLRAVNVRRTIRRAEDLETAWMKFAQVLPELGCEHARLDLQVRGQGRRQRRKTFEWAGEAANEGGAAADAHVIELPLRHDRRSLGSLTVKLQPVSEEEEVSLRSQTLDSLRQALALRSLDEARARARLRAARRGRPA